ncbi:MAG: hypothetical protein RL328_2809 [Acidobacteriota bacterium]|jgi:hypothetical protein
MRSRIAAFAAIGCLVFASAAVAESKKKAPEAYAIVGGTVFQDNGVAQPGAKVVLASKQQPGKKLQEQTSSPRGEFAFRVPPGPAAYVISASFKGFEVASKEVDIEAQEQVHKTLLLVPSSK